MSLGEGEYGVTDMLYAAARSKSSEVLLVFGEGEYGGAHWGYTFSLQVGDDEQGFLPTALTFWLIEIFRLNFPTCSSWERAG